MPFARACYSGLSKDFSKQQHVELEGAIAVDEARVEESAFLTESRSEHQSKAVVCLRAGSTQCIACAFPALLKVDD